MVPSAIATFWCARKKLGVGGVQRIRLGLFFANFYFCGQELLAFSDSGLCFRTEVPRYLLSASQSGQAVDSTGPTSGRHYSTDRRRYGIFRTGHLSVTTYILDSFYGHCTELKNGRIRTMSRHCNYDQARISNEATKETRIEKGWCNGWYEY